MTMLVLTESDSGLTMAIPKALVYFAARGPGNLLLNTKVLTGISSGGQPLTQFTVKEAPEEVVARSEGSLIQLTDTEKNPIGIAPGAIMYIHKSKDAILGSTVLTSLPTQKGGGMVFEVLESVEGIVTKISEAKAQQQMSMMVTRH